mmetsp:Transcript_37553/g.73920  ORF Transcript_37553/g.73920 Transcript_37553/m.73920 type:complete len:213 (+) Transcript_37553:2189-2827(+)
MLKRMLVSSLLTPAVSEMEFLLELGVMPELVDTVRFGSLLRLPASMSVISCSLSFRSLSLKLEELRFHHITRATARATQTVPPATPPAIAPELEGEDAPLFSSAAVLEDASTVGAAEVLVGGSDARQYARQSLLAKHKSPPIAKSPQLMILVSHKHLGLELACLSPMHASHVFCWLHATVGALVGEGVGTVVGVAEEMSGLEVGAAVLVGTE